MKARPCTNNCGVLTTDRHKKMPLCQTCKADLPPAELDNLLAAWQAANNMAARVIFKFAVVQVSTTRYRVARSLDFTCEIPTLYFETGPMPFVKALNKARELADEQLEYLERMQEVNEK